MLDLGIYKGKKVLVTGHTGFKGSWLSLWLAKLGAEVIGYSLPEYDNTYVYRKTGLSKKLKHDLKGDVIHFKDTWNAFSTDPDIVFHLAAQPLVRKSYDFPLLTFSTNIMGTANVLECVRHSPKTNCAVIITTDKCYKNKHKKEGYTEDDEMGGHDPYSASKACAEIVTASYRDSFFSGRKLVATARAGNVVGGGDFAKDRLIPDCIRSLQKKEPIMIRNPMHVRPWQHVLEPLYGYLLLGAELLSGSEKKAMAWNYGPEKNEVHTVREVTDIVLSSWGLGRLANKDDQNEKTEKKETELLLLDSSAAKKEMGWECILGFQDTIKWTVDWYKREEREDAYALSMEQIRTYEEKWAQKRQNRR